MRHSTVMSTAFSFVRPPAPPWAPAAARAPARFKIPPGATAFRVEGSPNAASAVPSLYPHYIARITWSVASGPPGGALLPGADGGDCVAQFDFLEHPWLWNTWIPLAAEDAAQGRGLMILDGANPGCAGAIQQGRVLWRIETEDDGRPS